MRRVRPSKLVSITMRLPNDLVAEYDKIASESDVGRTYVMKEVLKEALTSGLVDTLFPWEEGEEEEEEEGNGGGSY